MRKAWHPISAEVIANYLVVWGRWQLSPFGQFALCSVRRARSSATYIV